MEKSTYDMTPEELKEHWRQEDQKAKDIRENFTLLEQIDIHLFELRESSRKFREWQLKQAEERFKK